MRSFCCSNLAFPDSFSRRWYPCCVVSKFMHARVRTQLLSCVQPFVTPWTVAHEAFLSMGFPRQEYCSGLPVPPQGNLPNPGTEPMSLASSALAGGFFTTAPSENGAKRWCRLCEAWLSDGDALCCYFLF